MADVDGTNASSTFLAGGGEAGELMRGLDWTRTGLGRADDWPSSLKTAVALMLASPEPAFIGWGPELLSFYNDGYLPILGPKHPGIGLPFRLLWPGLWDELSPLIAKTLDGEVQHFTDMPLTLDRPVQPDGFYSFTYSPLRDGAGAIAGFYCAARETTERVLEARRQSFVLTASERLVSAHSVDEVVDVLRETARAAVGAEGIAVVLLDGDHCSYVAEDAIAPLWAGRRLPAATCISGWAMRNGQTVSIPDVRVDPRIPQEAYAPTFVRSLVMVPIGRPEPVAALGAYWSHVGDHGQATVERLESLARLATIALENARLSQARDRASALGAAQNRILQLAVTDAPLSGTLEAIVREVEALSTSGVIGTILLLSEDGRQLRHGAGPSMPAAYNAAIDGIAIGPTVGSCGSAAFRNEPVFVSDIAADPLWTDFRDLALAHELRACWSLPIRSAQGQVLGTFAMYHHEPREPSAPDLEMIDFVVRTAGLVIERSRAEAAVRRSEARHRQIVEGAEDYAIITYDAGGVITSWNSGAERMLGHSAAEAIGKPGALIFTPEDADSGAYDREFERAASIGRAVNERWHIRKDGARFWASGLMMPLAADYGGFLNIFRDRTVEHEAEARLRESEERLRLAVENADVGFWDVDVVNDRLIWPARTKAMFGISADAPVSMQDFYDGLHPDHRDTTSAAFAASADPRLRALYDVEYRTIGKEDGVVRWVAAKGRGVFDASGRCLRVAGTAVEVSARKEAEEALRELNATLEARIAEAIAEREKAQEALRQSQKMEAMGQLTGGVAHDFNNLLTPIVGALDMLQRRGLGGEREQRLIAGAMLSAERAKTLVQRLLAFARRQPLQPVPVDINKLMNGMGDLVASTTGPQIKVVVTAPDDLPPATADPNQVEMALLNLSVNARDAMPEGGTLRIAASLEQVEPGHRSKLKPGAYLCLSVADTGSGMDEATLAHAIEPFFSTKGVGKGTGLGLSMVHGLASQLGGALTIQSKPGLGTNVELWLPRSAAEASAAVPTTEVSERVTARGTALLVDDEELVRASTADMLIDLGYSVVEAASGEEALQLLTQGQRFDLLITDHLMPGVSGTELARTVRTTRPGVSVLLVSGYGEREGLDADLPRLTKPFRKDELALSLSELLSNK